MQLFWEGGSINRPTMLDDTNYPYWKACIRAFLKAMDEYVWLLVVNGWSPPTVFIDGEIRTKLANKSGAKELETDNWNSKAIHAIFNVVSYNQMKIIINCEIAKEAWDKLQTKNEGT